MVLNVIQNAVSHEIEYSLRDDGRDRPAQGPNEHSDKVHQVTIANRTQWRNRHESDEQRRQRVLPQPLIITMEIII